MKTKTAASGKADCDVAHSFGVRSATVTAVVSEVSRKERRSASPKLKQSKENENRKQKSASPQCSTRFRHHDKPVSEKAGEKKMAKPKNPAATSPKDADRKRDGATAEDSPKTGSTLTDKKKQLSSPEKEKVDPPTKEKEESPTEKDVKKPERSKAVGSDSLLKKQSLKLPRRSTERLSEVKTQTKRTSSSALRAPSSKTKIASSAKTTSPSASITPSARTRSSTSRLGITKTSSPDSDASTTSNVSRTSRSSVMSSSSSRLKTKESQTTKQNVSQSTRGRAADTASKTRSATSSAQRVTTRRGQDLTLKKTASPSAFSECSVSTRDSSVDSRIDDDAVSVVSNVSIKSTRSSTSSVGRPRVVEKDVSRKSLVKTSRVTDTKTVARVQKKSTIVSNKDAKTQALATKSEQVVKIASSKTALETPHASVHQCKGERPEPFPTTEEGKELSPSLREGQAKHSSSNEKSKKGVTAAAHETDLASKGSSQKSVCASTRSTSSIQTRAATLAAKQEPGLLQKENTKVSAKRTSLPPPHSGSDSNQVDKQIQGTAAKKTDKLRPQVKGVRTVQRVTEARETRNNKHGAGLSRTNRDLSASHAKAEPDAEAALSCLEPNRSQHSTLSPPVSKHRITAREDTHANTQALTEPQESLAKAKGIKQAASERSSVELNLINTSEQGAEPTSQGTGEEKKKGCVQREEEGDEEGVVHRKGSASSLLKTPTLSTLPASAKVVGTDSSYDVVSSDFKNTEFETLPASVAERQRLSMQGLGSDSSGVLTGKMACGTHHGAFEHSTSSAILSHDGTGLLQNGASLPTEASDVIVIPNQQPSALSKKRTSALGATRNVSSSKRFCGGNEQLSKTDLRSRQNAVSHKGPTRGVLKVADRLHKEAATARQERGRRVKEPHSASLASVKAGDTASQKGREIPSPHPEPASEQTDRKVLYEAEGKRPGLDKQPSADSRIPPASGSDGRGLSETMKRCQIGSLTHLVDQASPGPANNSATSHNGDSTYGVASATAHTECGLTQKEHGGMNDSFVKEKARSPEEAGVTSDARGKVLAGQGELAVTAEAATSRASNADDATGTRCVYIRTRGEEARADNEQHPDLLTSAAERFTPPPENTDESWRTQVTCVSSPSPVPQPHVPVPAAVQHPIPTSLAVKIPRRLVSSRTTASVHHRMTSSHPPPRTTPRALAPSTQRPKSSPYALPSSTRRGASQRSKTLPLSSQGASSLTMSTPPQPWPLVTQLHPSASPTRPGEKPEGGEGLASVLPTDTALASREDWTHFPAGNAAAAGLSEQRDAGEARAPAGEPGPADVAGVLPGEAVLRCSTPARGENAFGDTGRTPPELFSTPVGSVTPDVFSTPCWSQQDVTDEREADTVTPEQGKSSAPLSYHTNGLLSQTRLSTESGTGLLNLSIQIHTGEETQLGKPCRTEGMREEFRSVGVISPPPPSHPSPLPPTTVPAKNLSHLVPLPPSPPPALPLCSATAAAAATSCVSDVSHSLSSDGTAAPHLLLHSSVTVEQGSSKEEGNTQENQQRRISASVGLKPVDPNDGSIANLPSPASCLSLSDSCSDVGGMSSQSLMAVCDTQADLTPRRYYGQDSMSSSSSSADMIFSSSSSSSSSSPLHRKDSGGPRQSETSHYVSSRHVAGDDRFNMTSSSSQRVHRSEHVQYVSSQTVLSQLVGEPSVVPTVVTEAPPTTPPAVMSFTTSSTSTTTVRTDTMETCTGVFQLTERRSQCRQLVSSSSSSNDTNVIYCSCKGGDVTRVIDSEQGSVISSHEVSSAGLPGSAVVLNMNNANDVSNHDILSSQEGGQQTEQKSVSECENVTEGHFQNSVSICDISSEYAVTKSKTSSESRNEIREKTHRQTQVRVPAKKVCTVMVKPISTCVQDLQKITLEEHTGRPTKKPPPPVTLTSVKDSVMKFETSTKGRVTVNVRSGKEGAAGSASSIKRTSSMSSPAKPSLTSGTKVTTSVSTSRKQPSTKQISASSKFEQTPTSNRATSNQNISTDKISGSAVSSKPLDAQPVSDRMHSKPQTVDSDQLESKSAQSGNANKQQKEAGNGKDFPPSQTRISETPSEEGQDGIMPEAGEEEGDKQTVPSSMEGHSPPGPVQPIHGVVMKETPAVVVAPNPCVPSAREVRALSVQSDSNSSGVEELQTCRSAHNQNHVSSERGGEEQRSGEMPDRPAADKKHINSHSQGVDVTVALPRTPARGSASQRSARETRSGSVDMENKQDCGPNAVCQQDCQRSETVVPTVTQPPPSSSQPVVSGVSHTACTERSGAKITEPSRHGAAAAVTEDVPAAEQRLTLHKEQSEHGKTDDPPASCQLPGEESHEIALNRVQVHSVGVPAVEIRYTAQSVDPVLPAAAAGYPGEGAMLQAQTTDGDNGPPRPRHASPVPDQTRPPFTEPAGTDTSAPLAQDSAKTGHEPDASVNSSSRIVTRTSAQSKRSVGRAPQVAPKKTEPTVKTSLTFRQQHATPGVAKKEAAVTPKQPKVSPPVKKSLPSVAPKPPSALSKTSSTSSNSTQATDKTAPVRPKNADHTRLCKAEIAEQAQPEAERQEESACDVSTGTASEEDRETYTAVNDTTQWKEARTLGSTEADKPSNSAPQEYSTELQKAALRSADEAVKVPAKTDSSQSAKRDSEAARKEAPRLSRQQYDIILTTSSEQTETDSSGNILKVSSHRQNVSSINQWNECTPAVHEEMEMTSRRGSDTAREITFITMQTDHGTSNIVTQEPPQDGQMQRKTSPFLQDKDAMLGNAPSGSEAEHAVQSLQDGCKNKTPSDPCSLQAGAETREREQDEGDSERTQADKPLEVDTDTCQSDRNGNEQRAVAKWKSLLKTSHVTNIRETLTHKLTTTANRADSVSPPPAPPSPTPHRSKYKWARDGGIWKKVYLSDSMFGSTDTLTDELTSSTCMDDDVIATEQPIDDKEEAEVDERDSPIDFPSVLAMSKRFEQESEKQTQDMKPRLTCKKTDVGHGIVSAVTKSLEPSKTQTHSGTRAGSRRDTHTNRPENADNTDSDIHLLYETRVSDGHPPHSTASSVSSVLQTRTDSKSSSYPKASPATSVVSGSAGETPYYSEDGGGKLSSYTPPGQSNGVWLRGGEKRDEVSAPHLLSAGKADKDVSLSVAATDLSVRTTHRVKHAEKTSLPASKDAQGDSTRQWAHRPHSESTIGPSPSAVNLSQSPAATDAPSLARSRVSNFASCLLAERGGEEAAGSRTPGRGSHETIGAEIQDKEITGLEPSTESFIVVAAGAGEEETDRDSGCHTQQSQRMEPTGTFADVDAKVDTPATIADTTPSSTFHIKTGSQRPCESEQRDITAASFSCYDKRDDGRTRAKVSDSERKFAEALKATQGQQPVGAKLATAEGQRSHALVSRALGSAVSDPCPPFDNKTDEEEERRSMEKDCKDQKREEGSVSPANRPKPLVALRSGNTRSSPSPSRAAVSKLRSDPTARDSAENARTGTDDSTTNSNAGSRSPVTTRLSEGFKRFQKSRGTPWGQQYVQRGDKMTSAPTNMAASNWRLLVSKVTASTVKETVSGEEGKRPEFAEENVTPTEASLSSVEKAGSVLTEKPERSGSTAAETELVSERTTAENNSLVTTGCAGAVTDSPSYAASQSTPVPHQLESAAQRGTCVTSEMPKSDGDNTVLESDLSPTTCRETTFSESVFESIILARAPSTPKRGGTPSSTPERSTPERNALSGVQRQERSDAVNTTLPDVDSLNTSSNSTSSTTSSKLKRQTARSNITDEDSIVDRHTDFSVSRALGEESQDNSGVSFSGSSSSVTTSSSLSSSPPQRSGRGGTCAKLISMTVWDTHDGDKALRSGARRVFWDLDCKEVSVV